MKIPNIEDRSFLHSILRPPLDFYHNWIFNQRHYKLNNHKLPSQGPALVTFTHQCALMDSMLILALSGKWQPVHISRADLFEPTLQRKLLFFFKMMPVYRVRDGFRNVVETWDTFDKASEVFQKKQFIIIAPEANHVPKRRVRILSKGFARMAFKAEEDNDFKLGLKIIPVGFHYEDYYSARISVVSNVGDPIDFSDLHDLYKENPQQALLALRNRVADAMKKLIIHIEDQDKYEDCEMARYVGTWVLAGKKGVKVRNEKDRFLLGKEVVDKLRDEVKKQDPEMFEQIINKAAEYRKALEENKFNDFTVRKNTGLFKLVVKAIWYLITLPLSAYGFIFNVPIYYVPKIMTRNIKDPSFHTSVRFVFYMFLYPLYYILLYFLSARFIPDPWLRLGFIVSLPLAGFFTISWARGVRKWWEKLRFRFSKQREQLINLRNELADLLSKVL